METQEQFDAYREKMNERITSGDSLVLKRLFNLDTNAFKDGALNRSQKELIGLTCSLVLRCDDCVKYHLGVCKELGFQTTQIEEALAIANLIGGTIVIPHLRRAIDYWDSISK